MPNWVYTRVAVSGAEEAVKAFREKAEKPRPAGWDNKGEMEYTNPELSFWNFISPPQEAVDSGEYFGTNGYQDGKAVGKTPNNWYEFNTREWGTKWDCCSPSIESYDSTSVSYYFETAWSPAQPVFEAMVEQHQELHFDIWWEEEQGFGAELSTSIEDGISVLSIDKEWDVPSSHADFVAKDEEQSCICSWESEPDQWYSDCPGFKSMLDNDQEPDLVY